MKKKDTRRKFIKTTATGTLGYMLLAGCQTAQKKVDANSKLRVAHWCRWQRFPSFERILR